MSSTTPRLGLILPDGPDLFERTDFVNNYDKIDQYPGLFPCTSTTRPVWGPDQNGQCIIETDTRRILVWLGSTWHDIQGTSSAWLRAFGPVDPVTMTSNQSVTYTLGTFNLLRPASLAILLHVNMKQLRYDSFGVRLFPQIDGAYAGAFDPNRGDEAGELSQWHTYGTEGLWNDYRVISTVGLKALSAGTHTAGVQIKTFQGSGSIQRISLLGFLVNTTDVS